MEERTGIHLDETNHGVTLMNKKDPKQHNLAYKIWRVIYPLFIFLGVQVVAGIVMSLYYMITVLFPGASQGVDPLILTQQLQDWVISQSLLLALICDGLILPLFAFMYIHQKKRQKRPTLSSFKITDYLLVAALAVFADFSITYIIVGFRLEQYFPDYQNIMSGISSSSFALQIIAVGIVAPLAEEFLMRGVVLDRLLGYVRVLPAVIIQAALFGILHLNFLQGIYAGVLGLLMGYIYVKYGSLLMTILFHITLNTLSIIFPENFAQGISPFFILIPALILTIGTLWIINRRGGLAMFISDKKLEKVPQEKGR